MWVYNYVHQYIYLLPIVLDNHQWCSINEQYKNIWAINAAYKICIILPTGMNVNIFVYAILFLKMFIHTHTHTPPINVNVAWYMHSVVQSGTNWWICDHKSGKEFGFIDLILITCFWFCFLRDTNRSKYAFCNYHTKSSSKTL